jgi:hypothetical protein
MGYRCMQPAYHSCQDAAYVSGTILYLPAYPSSMLQRRIGRERCICTSSGKQPSGALFQLPSQHPAFLYRAGKEFQHHQKDLPSQRGEANVDLLRKNKFMSRRSAHTDSQRVLQIATTIKNEVIEVE